MTTKSCSIKSTVCRFGGCVRKAVELTSGDLPFGVQSGLSVERSILTGRQKSAEGVLVALYRLAGKLTVWSVQYNRARPDHG
jgi:hypothetical protein